MNPQVSTTQIERSLPLVARPNQETNQLQMVVSPLGGRSLLHVAQISTTMISASTNLVYGLPNYHSSQGGIGGSGHAHQLHEPFNPHISWGLGPIHDQGYYDYSDPYTDDSSSKEDD